MELSPEVRKKAYELSSKVSNQRWKECMDRWNSLSKEQQSKYNQLVGFNDISDMLLNDIADGYIAGYKQAIKDLAPNVLIVPFNLTERKDVQLLNNPSGTSFSSILHSMYEEWKPLNKYGDAV